MTRDRLYIETVEQIMTNTTKVLIDQRSGSNNLLYLPLDRLIQMTGPGGAGVAATKPEVPAPAEQSTARSREAFRSREREPR